MKIVQQLLDPKSLRAVCKSLKYMDSGSSRRVYRLNKTRVLKVASSKRGFEQNKYEVFVYNSVGDSLVARIYWYAPDYKWLISEYLDESDTTCRQESRVMSGIIRSGIHIDEMHEFGKDSKGRVKLLDYGLSSEIYNKYYR